MPDKVGRSGWETAGRCLEAQSASGQRLKGSHLDRRLAQLRAQSRVLERLASLLLAQAEASEERHRVHSRHGRDNGNRKKTLGPISTLTLAH